MRPDDPAERPDDLTRRRLLGAAAVVAGLTGSAVVAGATGAGDTAPVDSRVETSPTESGESPRDPDGGARDRDCRFGRPASDGSTAERPSGTVTAVVDRFEGDRAVLVLERDGETVGELVADADDLPADGRHVDAVLEVTLDDGDLVDAEYDPGETEDRAENAQRRSDRLSRRPPGDGDRRETPACPDDRADGEGCGPS